MMRGKKTMSSDQADLVHFPSRPERKSLFLASGDIDVSFEFFPPGSALMEDGLWRAIRRLEPLRPTSVSVTYGAGGSTRERTHATIARLFRETTLNPAAHLTCIGATRAEIDRIARMYWDLGVRHIVAIRGDAPAGERYDPTPGGYERAVDLVEGLKAVADFEITVAAHPERHPDSATLATDIEVLKAKIDAGATRIITQFVFDTDRFLRFEERARSRGITAPIIPGILPIHNFAQVAAMASRVGVGVPAWLVRRFEGLENDSGTQRLAAAAFAAEQVLGLVDRGVTEFHFYTLNRADLVYGICHMLGLRPQRHDLECRDLVDN